MFRSVVASILRNTSSAGAITSGPMPSPASTAMWRALLADMGFPYAIRKMVIVIASGAKQSTLQREERMDCFARNDGGESGILRRQHRPPDELALLQIDQRLVGFRQRHRRHRDRRDLLGTDQVEQFLGFAEIADIAALDRDRLDRDHPHRPRRAAP